MSKYKLTDEEKYYAMKYGFPDWSGPVPAALASAWLEETAECKHRKLVRGYPSWFKIARRIGGRRG